MTRDEWERVQRWIKRAAEEKRIALEEGRDVDADRLGVALHVLSTILVEFGISD